MRDRRGLRAKRELRIPGRRVIPCGAARRLSAWAIGRCAALGLVSRAVALLQEALDFRVFSVGITIMVSCGLVWSLRVFMKALRRQRAEEGGVFGIRTRRRRNALLERVRKAKNLADQVLDFVRGRRGCCAQYSWSPICVAGNMRFTKLRIALEGCLAKDLRVTEAGSGRK